MIGIFFKQNYLPIIFILVIHPVFDTWIGRKKPDLSKIKASLFDNFLLLTAVAVYAMWIFCFYFFVTAPSFSDAIVVAISGGLVMGFLGITTSHELVHRPDGLLKWSGFAMLWILNYGHWGVEHVFGHHKNVATPNDPVSAKKNETIYVYLVRAIVGSFVHSFEFEKQKSFFKSKVRLSLSIQIAMNVFIFALFGFNGIIFHWTQSLVAAVLLESVEYIEHYGLARKKMESGLFEPVSDLHSWDCDYYLTNTTLINLGYHSHHHQKPLVPYQDLPSKVGRRLLPWGYSAMILIAFLPPLFFHLMNPRIDQDKKQDVLTA